MFSYFSGYETQDLSLWLGMESLLDELEEENENGKNYGILRLRELRKFPS
jgi:hypothetical protein